MLQSKANLQKLSQFRLFSAIREHEGGIASNRESARHGESISRVLYTPPVTPRYLVQLEIVKLTLF